MESNLLSQLVIAIEFLVREQHEKNEIVSLTPDNYIIYLGKISVYNLYSLLIFK